MVVYNAASREVTAKIVYCGPGLSGKTTNLQFLHRRLEPSAVGQLLTLAATADRTIFFDLLPVELGDLKGYRIRFQVATVPGQSPYNETRRVVLRGVDGVVFVADSRWSMLPKNLESFQNLKENIEAEGLKLGDIPVIVQFNKRDLADVLTIEALQEGLGLAKFPFVEAVATQGKGVVETFKLISKLTFVDILKRLQKRQDIRTVRDDSGASKMFTWKNTLLHSAEAGKAPAAPAAPASPARPASETAEDANMTMAIPISRLRGGSPPEPPKLDLPFAENPASSGATPPPAAPSMLENPFAAAATDSAGPSEDTNPAYFPPPPAAPALASADDTAGMATGAIRAVRDADIRAPQPTSPTESTAEIPTVPRETDSPAAPPAKHLAELGERLDRQDERIAGFDDIALRLAHLEEKSAVETHVAELRERVDGLEKRLARESEIASNTANDLRRDHATSRLALEGAVKELSATVDAIRRDLAELSSREMEMVAQISRESLALQAGSEKLGFRMSEVESKFSDLAIAHTSRIGRLEQLLDELSQRSVSDREDIRRSLTEAHAESARLRAALDEVRHGPDRHREALAGLFADLAERLRGKAGGGGA